MSSDGTVEQDTAPSYGSLGKLGKNAAIRQRMKQSQGKRLTAESVVTPQTPSHVNEESTDNETEEEEKESQHARQKKREK